MLIWITYVPDADRRGPDLTRMNKVEEVPDELARMMLQDGSAREATADELAAHEEQASTARAADSEDLSKKLKADLEAMAADLGVDVPDGAKKADIVKAIEDHRASLEQTHADTLAMTRTDVATSGDPAGTIAAVNEQTAAAEAGTAEGSG